MTEVAADTVAVTAPAAVTDTDPDTSEDLLRVVVRAVFAMVLAELGGTAVLLLALVDHGVVNTGPTTAAVRDIAAHALGFGLGAGFAYAWADAVTRHRHLVLGLVLGALLAPVAPLAGSFEQALLSTKDVVTATKAVVTALHGLTPEVLYLCVAGALFVHGPALVAWRRGVHLPGSLAACAWGGALFSVAAAPLAERFDVARLSDHWTLLAVRCALFPLGLLLGDPLGRWLSRRVRRAPVTMEPRVSWSPLPRMLAPLLSLLPLALVVRGTLAGMPVAPPSAIVAAWTIREPEAAWRVARDLLPDWNHLSEGGGYPRAPRAPGPWLDLVNVAASLDAWTGDPDPRAVGHRLLRRAADAGHMRAMMFLGVELGLTDAREAERWLRTAAATGDPDAAWVLGYALLHGWSNHRGRPTTWLLPDPANRAEGLRWLCHAARHGRGLEDLARHGVPPAEVVDLARAHARDARTELAALTLERLLARWPHLRRARLDDPLRPPPRPWSPASEVAFLAPFLPDAVPGPDDPDVERALQALHQDDLDEAVRRAEGALDRAPDHAGALTLLGLAALLRGRAADPIEGRDLDLAIACLARAERGAPRDPTVVLHLALAHAHRALRERPFDMVATSEAFERLVLIESQGDGYARTLRQGLHERLGYAAPVITPERAEDALARRQRTWLRQE